MRSQRRYGIISFKRLLTLAGLLVLVFALSTTSQAQNTKGDKPTSGRESRFKNPFKKGGQKKKPGKRISPKQSDSQRAYVPRRKSKGGERAGRPIRPTYHSKRPSERQRPWSGDITGRRIKAKTSARGLRDDQPHQAHQMGVSTSPRKVKRRDDAPSKRVAPRPPSATGRVKNVFRQSGPYVRTSPKRVKTNQNVYPQYGRYVNNPSKKPQRVEKVQSNRPVLARLKRLQGEDKRPGKKRRVVPRSASGAFIARKSPNTWAHFPRPKRKGEKAYIKDIAGKKLRTKNYETPRPEIIPPTFKPYYGRKRVGDRPYKGPAGGGYMSATRTGRAWKGDVTGRKIRGRNYSSKKTVEGRPIFPPRLKKIRSGDKAKHAYVKGGGFKTASKPGEKRAGKWPVPVKTPGIGADMIGKFRGNLRLFQAKRGMRAQGEGFTGTIKARRPAKGGGTKSGKMWNNQGFPVQVKSPGVGADGIGKYQGGLKSRRPAKGGKESSYPGNIRKFQLHPGYARQGEGFTGSIKAKRPQKGGGTKSGKLWNNKGLPVPGKTPGMGADRIRGYSGTIKARRPVKGGGSVSGKLWNNQQKPIAGKTPGIGADRIRGFQGTIKARRPDKGGGSVSGKLWNNQQKPIAGKTPGIGADRIRGFQGTIKAKRPAKGGGSVSGKLWNNRETPIPGKTMPATADDVAKYPGNIKRFQLKPGFNNQGEEYSGSVRLSRFKKNYVRNPNAADEALKKKRPDKNMDEVEGLQVRVKRKGYVENKNADDEALKKLKPSPTTYEVAELQVRAKRRNYVKNPNASDESLLKLKPTKNTYEVGELQVKVKQPNYVRNSSSSDEAMKVREPGKAFARATDYQGNIKMKKFELFGNRELHPDAKFMKINKNNVAEEKDVLTNFKLWWSRLFRKNETQPDHLKEKQRKPRYDSSEKGLWYE